MFVSVETDQARGDTVPYRAGRDALTGQEHSLGHAKSWVVQHRPNQFVARDQMAAFIMRAKGEFSPPTPATQRFTDVPPSNTFYNFIDRMAVLNITLGCTPDHLYYCPADTVTRAQMAAFLVRAFNL